VAIIESIFSWIIGLGSGGMLTFAVLIIGLIFRIELKRAIRAALMMGIGLGGILTVVTAILLPAIVPVMEAIPARLGLQLEIVDIGWAAAGAAWAWPGAFLVIPIFLALDVLLISLRLTRVLWVDIWGFWNALFIGGIAWAMSGSVTIGVVVTLVLMTIQMLMADWSANKMQEYFDMPGVCWEVYSCSLYAWTAPVLDRIISFIPGVNKIQLDPDTIQRKIGFVGEPVIQGFIIGAVLGLISGLGSTAVITTGIALASAMVILPKMVSILMEGIMPLTTSIREFLLKHFKDREIIISLDNATLLGHPSVIAASLIAMPLIIVMAGILPGNMILPTVSIVAVPWWISSFAAQTKGNVFKMVVMMMFWAAIALYVTSYIAPGQTLVAAKLGIATEAIAGGATVGTLTPSDPFAALVYFIMQKMGFGA
jgi:PTS system galactitol-specific IIC component